MINTKAPTSILLVDDDPYFLSELSDLTLYIQAEVFPFLYPADAIMFAKNHVVNVLVTDFSMADIDGVTLANEVLLLHKNAMIIVISGNDVNKEKWVNTWHFLRKPLDLDILIQCLRTLGTM